MVHVGTTGDFSGGGGLCGWVRDGIVIRVRHGLSELYGTSVCMGSSEDRGAGVCLFVLFFIYLFCRKIAFVGLLLCCMTTSNLTHYSGSIIDTYFQFN